MDFKTVLKAWLNNGQKIGFNGCIIGLSVPPIHLPFQIAPEIIEEKYDPNFTFARHPSNKYSYPIFTGMSERYYTFQLQWDAMSNAESNDSESEDSCDSGDSTLDTILGDSYRSKKGHFNDAKVLEIQQIRAAIDTLKSPHTGLGNALTRKLKAASPASLISSVTHTSPDISEPCPPLAIFLPSLDPYDWRVGYFTASVQRTGFDKHMRCTAIQANCTFYVTPDYVFTTFEELCRELLTLLGLAGNRNVTKMIRSAKKKAR